LSSKLEREEYERKMEAQMEREARKQQNMAGFDSPEDGEGKKKRKRQQQDK